jgi:hypothetical protein
MVLAVLWETVGREEYLYKNILVVTKDIQKGELITEDKLKYIKIEEDKIISNPVTTKKDIMNLAAKHYIPKYSQLSREFFDDPGIVLKKDQFIFNVPADWIKAVPSSIRRKDTALFYEIKNTDTNSGTAQSASQTEPASNTTAVAEQGINMYNLKDDDWLKTFDVKSFVTNADGKVKEPVIVATVAYVKDSSNKEVVDSDGKMKKDGRLDGSSEIQHIEIVVTLKDLRAMELSIANGNQFLVLSQEN